MGSVVALRKEGYRLLHEGAIALSKVEANGIHINMESLTKTRQELAEKSAALENDLLNSKLWKRWLRWYGVKSNLGSGDQLATILYEDMGFPIPSRTDSGQPSVDEEALVTIPIPEIPKLIRYLKYEKANGTFLTGIEKEVVGCRLHPFFHLHTTRTYRSSSSEPNFQNQPVRDKEISEIIRKNFTPRKGCVLVENDFKGIEVALSACVTADTKITTLDGDLTILEISKRLETDPTKPIYTYGYSQTLGRICVRKILGGGKTKKNAEIWEVELDNGKTVRATPDHKFMLRTGEYRRLDCLMPGDSLMPLYREPKKSQHRTVYEKIYLNNGQTMLTHNLVALDVFGEQIHGTKKVVHHIDGYGQNNRVGNLRVMTRKEHMRIHSIQGWERKGKGKRMTGWWDSAQSQRMMEKRQLEWTQQDWEEFGNRVSEGIARNGGRAGPKNSMHGKRHTSATKLKISRAKMFCHGWMKGKHLSEETRRKISLATMGRKGPWGPDRKPPPISEETRMRLSEAMKGRVFSESTREKIAQQKLKYWGRIKSSAPSAVCPICSKSFYSIGSHMRHKHPTMNHKVIAVRKLDHREDVYNIDVEECFNFATAAGVIIKNSYHKDPNFISYITTPGKDMHRDMAAQIFCIEPAQVSKDARYGAKNKFVFPQFYGDWFYTCAKSLWDWAIKGKLMVGDVPMLEHLASVGIEELGDWNPDDKDNDPEPGTFIAHLQEIEDDFWNNRFKHYGQWRRDWYDAYLDKGYFDILTGFRVAGTFGRNAVTNYPIQGSAFHCLLWSLIQVQRKIEERGMEARIVGQIHDSLISEVPFHEVHEYLTMVEKVTTKGLPWKYPWLAVPPEIEYEIATENWFKKREMKFKDGRFIHPTDSKKTTTDFNLFIETLNQSKK